jgi:crotonobetaine/carnitine-CoA ligase
MTRPQTTVLAALAERLSSDPDGPYLDFSSAGESVKLTGREMDREANRLAHTLRELGVEHGDRVATLLENRAEQVVTFFAALKLGAVQVPINTAYKGEFLRHQLADSGAKVFVVQGEFASRAVEVVGDDATPDLTFCITVDPPDAVIDARPTISWQDALSAASDAPVADVTVRPSDLACFIYTAGTTGPSKGCMLSHNYIVSLADQIARAWQRRPDDVIFTPLPLFHFNAISVCVVGTLLVGGRAAIERRFSVSNFWPEIKRTDATMVSMLGSPAILIANADDHPDQQGHRLRLCAAAPMPPDTDRAWRERFGCKTFSAGYGLT